MSQESLPRQWILSVSTGEKQHKLCCYEWGNSEKPAIICCHGLTRNARDFDPLAQELSKSYRVIAFDLPGRGLSDRLPHPTDYSMAQYMHDIRCVLRELNLKSFIWLGTSLGGLLGMLLATEVGAAMRGLILNDIGPELPGPAFEHLSNVVAHLPTFKQWDEFVVYIKYLHQNLGALTANQLQHLAKYHGFRQSNGEITWHFDSKIFSNILNDLKKYSNGFELFKLLQCPLFIIRGGLSIFLPQEQLEKMLQLQPNAHYTIIDDVGHAPLLMRDSEIQRINAWLAWLESPASAVPLFR